MFDSGRTEKFSRPILVTVGPLSKTLIYHDKTGVFFRPSVSGRQVGPTDGTPYFQPYHLPETLLPRMLMPTTQARQTSGKQDLGRRFCVRSSMETVDRIVG